MTPTGTAERGTTRRGRDRTVRGTSADRQWFQSRSVIVHTTHAGRVITSAGVTMYGGAVTGAGITAVGFGSTATTFCVPDLPFEGSKLCDGRPPPCGYLYQANTVAELTAP